MTDTAAQLPVLEAALEIFKMERGALDERIRTRERLIAAIRSEAGLDATPTPEKLAEHGIRPQDGDPRPDRSFAEQERDRA